MNHPQLDQAREWAESIFDAAGNGFPVGRSAQDTAQFVKSLPDEWIDAEKVRELLDKWAANPFPTSDEVAVLNDVEALLAPKLPTLADMTPEEREACLWMQVELTGHLPGAVLTDPGGHDSKPRVMYQDGSTFTVEHEDVTPLPGEPKLEWPGSEPESTHFDNLPDEAKQVMKESIEEYKAGKFVDFDSSPRPEDVPAGEAWLVKCAGFEGEWLGTRSPNPDRNYPWMLTKPRTQEREIVQDSKVTLVSRLVPEVGA